MDFCYTQSFFFKHRWKKLLQKRGRQVFFFFFFSTLVESPRFCFFFLLFSRSLVLPLYRSIATSTATIAPPAVSKQKLEWDTWQGRLLYMHETKNKTRDSLKLLHITAESRDATLSDFYCSFSVIFRRHFREGCEAFAATLIWNILDLK